MDQIKRNIKDQDKYEVADKYNKRLQDISRNTSWFESKNKYENYYKSKNVQKQTKLEVENAKAEVQTVRRARLKKLYEEEAKKHTEELAKMGLKILKDRD